MSGTYTCTERVVRGGVLVAFAGEVMTMAEAERRGLLAPAPAPEQATEPEPEPEPEPKPARKARKKAK